MQQLRIFIHHAVLACGVPSRSPPEGAKPPTLVSRQIQQIGSCDFTLAIPAPAIGHRADDVRSSGQSRSSMDVSPLPFLDPKRTPAETGTMESCRKMDQTGEAAAKAARASSIHPVAFISSKRRRARSINARSSCELSPRRKRP
jgi:hypothetical protein